MVSILCPCYNEEAVLPLFFQKIVSVMEGIGEDFEIVCVNDGSHDGTLSLRNLETALKMIDAGADRLGCSSCTAIMRELSSCR